MVGVFGKGPEPLGSLAKPLVMVKEGRARSQDVMGVVLSLEASIFIFLPGVKAFSLARGEPGREREPSFLSRGSTLSLPPVPTGRKRGEAGLGER